MNAVRLNILIFQKVVIVFLLLYQTINIMMLLYVCVCVLCINSERYSIKLSVDIVTSINYNHLLWVVYEQLMGIYAL